MKKHNEVGLNIQGAKLHVQVIEASRCGATVKGSCAIEIKGNILRHHFKTASQ